MLSALTPSELAGIRDIAITRSTLERRSPESGVLRAAELHPDDGTRAEIRARLVSRIAALDEAARNELEALVRLGRGEADHAWSTLLELCGSTLGEAHAELLASDPSLDAHIERGLLALQSHPR
jgi:hypothetical protein